MYKKDFPILLNNEDLLYLDSAATVQKPTAVIEGIKHYLEHDYANIHRGWYSLSERSEEMFWAARRKTAEWIGAAPEEVIFTSSSTDSVNLLASSLALSWVLKKWNVIVLCEADHHADIVPWQMIAKQHECEIKWVGVTDTWYIDTKALEWIVEDGGMRLFACHMVSNVLGIENDIKKIKQICGDDVLLVVDWSQSVPHMPVDVADLWCDFFFFTWHKIGAQTGIWVLYGKKKHLDALTPARGWWWSIESVSKGWFTLLWSPDKFEPGTPNLIGVASMLYAFEWMESFTWSKEWFYEALKAHEEPLIQYSIDRFKALKAHWVRLLWWVDDKIGLFSFILPEGKQATHLGQYMAAKNIAMRCGGHCAHPYHESLDHSAWSCRVSYWLYTEMDEVEKFFDELEKYLQS